MRILNRISFWPIPIALAVTLAATAARAVDVTWTGAVSTDWNNTNNWSPQRVPTSGDHVFINSGSVSVGTSAEFAVLDWGGGTISGILTVVSGGVLNLVGSDTKTLSGNTTLTNYGTINWQGGQFVLRYYNAAPRVWNCAGGVFDIQCDNALTQENGAGPFYNSGQVRKSAGSGTNTMGVSFNNTGTVQVQSGGIQFVAGQVSGFYQANVGTAILFQGGGYTLSPSPVLSGEGFIGFASSVSMNGAFAGHLDWSAGALTSGTRLTVLSNGVLNLVGSGTKTLSGNTTLTNYGTVNWQGGQFDLQYYNAAPRVWNCAGGVFDIQCDNALTQENGAGPFYNSGQVRKSAGSGTNTIGVSFNNTGLLELGLGTVRMTGNYAPAASSTLTFSLGGDTPGDQYGRVQVNGTATLAGTIAVWTTNGYTPSTGTVFTNLIAGTLSGSFANSNLLALESGQPFLCVYTNKMVLLKALPWDPHLVITTQPTNQTVLVGGNAAFDVRATGALPRTCQWRLNGSDLPAGTNTALTLSGIQTNAAGAYSVVISNAYGSVTSNPGILTVNLAAPFAITSSFTFTNGAFGFAFTNNPGTPFTVLSATNLSQPLGDWTSLTGLTELSPGQFEFTDPDATNNPQRFYRVRSP
jgi:hypothetical protein